MSKVDIYQEINANFYDEQLRSLNPLRRWFHSNRYRIINSFVKSFYVPGTKIIDIGSGSCVWNKDNLPVYGIDCNEQLLLYGKTMGRLTDCKVADVLNNGFADNTFNIIVATEVLEHIEDVDAAVKEAYRILDNHGVFIISVPYDRKFTAWNILFFVQTFYRGNIRGDLYYKKQCGHMQHFSPDSLNELFRRCGFKIEVIFSVCGFSIFLVARKGNCNGVIQKNYDDLTIVIPVKNEVNNIGNVIKELLYADPNLNIIVSDDGSEDGTIDLVRGLQRNNKNIVLLDRRDEKIKGLTVSVLNAIELVRTKYFIVMDGDGQHETKHVDRIYNQLKQKSELSVASRISVPGWRWDRKFISKLGSFLGRRALSLRKKKGPHDILSGFFGIESDYWKKIVTARKQSFSLKGYKVLFDFLKICDSNINIENVYYVFNQRLLGSSKLSWKIYIEYLKSLLRPR